MSQPKYKRVLLKISGEALAGEAGTGLDFKVMKDVCTVVGKCVAEGVEVGVGLDLNPARLHVGETFVDAARGIVALYEKPHGDKDGKPVGKQRVK